jgi:hypothetical protein
MITTQSKVIDLDDLDAVRAAITKANKKATKIGVPGYVLVEGTRGHRDITVPDPVHPGSWKVIGQIETVEVEVLGQAPRYAGWTFVATLAWDGDNVVIRKIDGLDVDTTAARPNLKPLWCDHCNTARDRNETYLLVSDTGEFKQVGSTCLREFLGVEVNLHLIGFNPYEGCDSSNRYAPSRYATLQVLQDTLAIVRAYGWLSASAAYNHGGTSTKSRLAEAYEDHRTEVAGRSTPAQEYREAIAREYREGDEALAAEILNWVRNVLPTTSEYAQNLRAAVGEPETGTLVDGTQFVRNTFRRDNLGLVVSAVTGYQRWTEKETARKVETANTLNEYVGTVKDRLRDLHLTVTSTRWISSDYGTSLLVVLRDEAGHAFKWFASNAPQALETVGQQVVLDGTVKKHEEYNGRKSTVLTRCSVKEVVAA